MASFPIPNPDIANGIRPVQVEPYGAAAERALTLGDLMQQRQLRQQQLAAGNIELQQKQIALRDQQAMTQAMQQWDAKDPNQLVDLARKNGASANKIFELQTLALNHRKELGAADEVDLKNRATRADAMQSLFSPLADVADPTEQKSAYDAAMQEAIRQRLTTPEEAALHPYPGPQGITPYIKGLDYEKYTLGQQQQQRANQAAAGAKKDEAELPGIQADAQTKQIASASQQLSGAKSSQDYAAAWNQLPAGIARRFPTPEQWTPQTPAIAQRIGLTSEQATTADQAAANAAETAKRDQQTARNENANTAISRGRLSLEQKKFDATIGSGLDANGQPLSADALKQAALQDPTAVAIANYQIPPPAGRTTPIGMAIMRKVLAIDPQYDGTQFQARNKTAQDFSASGASGKAITSADTALAHLDAISRAGRALDNGDYKALNRIANEIGAQVGASPRNTYDTIVGMVSPEISKAVIGGAGGEGERQAMALNFKSDLAPKVREQAVGAAAQLLNARVQKMGHAYESTMGKPFARQLSPESKAVLDRYSGKLPDGDGKVIDKETARQFYDAAGGDPVKARALAQQNHWKVQ
jgi:hypothetical protein